MDASLISAHFPDLTKHKIDQFEQLGSVYHEWNEKINVVSRKDIEQLYLRHILHSLSIARFVQFKPTTQILDVGTGGGFPGIPLAIAFPESHFTLVDSIGKKIVVVNAVIDALALSNARGEHLRAEQINGKYDFVITRAVARSRLLWNWCHQKISQESFNTIDNGIIALKGGDLADELAELKRPYRIQDISGYFSDPFFETKQIVHIPR